MPYSLLKKANIATVYGTWQCSACACSSVSARKRLKPNPNPQFPPQSRNYADVSSGSRHDYRDSMNWPCRKTTSWTPSPYEIFDLAKDAVYSKHKFYELVKLYHPDRNGIGPSEEISHGERLERYRLVVQAHEILSDPIKRRAYDASGVGWGATGAATANRHSRGFSNGHGKRYGFGPDDDSSIFKNATWEDWERWYRRHDNPHKQDYSGIYLHQNTFASIVILLAVISGVYQATRAGQYSGRLEEQTKALSEETAQFLKSRAEEYQENQLDVDGRIKHFLAKRDPSKYGLKDEETTAYRTHFAERHVIRPMPRLQDPGSE